MEVGSVLDDDGVLDVGFRLRPIAVVDEERAAAGIQARPHQLPERRKRALGTCDSQNEKNTTS